MVEQNRLYWEAIAPGRLGESIEFLRSGGSALTDDELALIGDPTGLRVLQLACSVGDESLTLARNGAQVTAVDLAEGHLRTGRQKAAALGVKINFLRQDMMALAPELAGFDRVLISGGGLCWVPDLDRWAVDVAGRLTPGGRIVISEHHPLWEVLTVNGENSLLVSADYFGQGRDGYTDPMKAPQVTWGSTAELPEHRSFVWGIGAVVTALVAAGLMIESLREWAAPDMYPGLGTVADRIPSAYLLSAARP
ncbi:Methyltransferase domain-containing protein [Microlunatus soli]|uniref:Methyltransferase domain-containing protein n=1 Tax=Microlunatus soli TaxID=630515 RepID=A0A1H1VWW4_9ACTN|nr:Methyltransferase domain-containing protein [Microlunatus soli]